MKNSCKNLLELIYNHTQNNESPFQCNADGSDTGYKNAHALANDIRWLIDNHFVSSPIKIINSHVLELTEKGENFVENDFQLSNAQHTTFNFENATINNAIIGSQSNAVLNINDTIQKAREQICSSNSNDKAELQQIINLLEMITNEQIPAKKGVFSKFSAVMERNSWITGSITSALLSWLTTL